MVETGVVIVLVVLLLMGIVEYGRILMIRQLLLNAAQEGARLASVSSDSYPPVTTAQIQNQVQTYLAGQGAALANLNIQVYGEVYDPVTNNVTQMPWNSMPFGVDPTGDDDENLVVVQIDGDYQPLLPSAFGMLPSQFHMRVMATMLSEAN